MMFVKLFWSFFQIGLFSIGGGYAAMPLIQNQVVDFHSWITLTEFTDLVTISQMTPGPIAINAATFIGIRLGGIPGALVATVGCVLPSCLVISVLYAVYTKYNSAAAVQGVLNGLRPAVVALIAGAGVSMALLSFFGLQSLGQPIEYVDWAAILLFSVSLLVLRIAKWNPIWIMLGCGLVGAFVYGIFPGA
jgi:chromate transporter